MKLQLWRNATLQLKIHNSTFLIDPMLGGKGTLGKFPWTSDQRENPLVELPFSNDQLRNKLKSIDAVFVSHLHPDHWDEAAINLIDKSTLIICPSAVSEAIASYGFKNIHVLNEQLIFDEITLDITNGQHGTGEIRQKMGEVSGLVLQHGGISVYIAGDTVWCEDVRKVIDTYSPKHIVVAGGAATFAIGDPVTMTAQQIQELAGYAPDSMIWITHLESISPCSEDRTFLTDFLHSHGLQDQCRILNDGEEVELLG
ncbi:MBL fold metallo-hydrolase [Balneola sp. MJW-20]|uniref:MBL fold metallo-hydrolase n=1 Tax=Gracilimonas aurantiaca TaxID=3234185 RepID=UPI003467A3A6